MAETLEFPSFEARVVTLGNGLEILVREDAAAPVVSLQAWCRSGSIHEGRWLGAGLSHFLEHMLFKGGGGRSASEIAKEVQAQGGYINAYTSFDRTVYWIDAPASGALGCLEVLCDVVGSAALPEDEFESEAEVIRREIAMGEDNPDQVLSKLFFRTAYAVHPCRHPVIGYRELFDELRREDLLAYYQERYSPDKLFFVLVGDLDADRAVALVEERLGGLKRGYLQPVYVPDEPRQGGPRQGELTFPTELHRERIAWQIPDGIQPEAAAFDLLATVLGGGRSSRLFQSIRETQGLAHSVGAWAYTPSFAGQFALHFDTEPEKADAAREAVLRELDRLLREGIRQDELEKARRQILSAQFSLFTEVRALASDLGSNWLQARHPDLTRDYVAAVQAVGREELRVLAETWLQPGMQTTAALLPQKRLISPPSVRAQRSEAIRRVELDNGLTVLLLEDHRVPFVQATGVFRGGLLAESADTAGLTRLMSRLLTKDTQRRSAEALALEIESVGGGIGASAGNNSFGASVHALRPDLDLVVDLLGESLLEPAFLEETVERERTYQLSQIKAEADRPFTVAMKALRRELYGGHPYGLEPSGTEESLSRLDRAAIESMHRRLVVGGNGVLGVFGDLDVDRAETLVRARFEGPLAPGHRLFTEPPLAPGRAGKGLVELQHDKEQAVLLIGFRTVALAHPDNPSLELIDEACSDMASRLFIRIREELGLAYSVGATRMSGLASGMLVFYASTAPEKLDLVQEEMLKEIDGLAREGIAREEFERAKASWLGREAIHLQSVRELASTATVDELVGLGWDHYRKVPEVVRALDPETVREVAARHLCEAQRVIVRLMR